MIINDGLCSVLGLAENMSYLACPDYGKEIDVFGKEYDICEEI